MQILYGPKILNASFLSVKFKFSLQVLTMRSSEWVITVLWCAPSQKNQSLSMCLSLSLAHSFLPSIFLHISLSLLQYYHLKRINISLCVFIFLSLFHIISLFPSLYLSPYLSIPLSYSVMMCAISKESKSLYLYFSFFSLSHSFPLSIFLFPSFSHAQFTRGELI